MVVTPCAAHLARNGAFPYPRSAPNVVTSDRSAARVRSTRTCAACATARHHARVVSPWTITPRRVVDAVVGVTRVRGSGGASAERATR
jgi:hypothetical protein